MLGRQRRPSMPNGHAHQTECTLAGKVHALYTSGDEAALQRMTQLLIGAICNEDGISLSALNDFFGLPVLKSDSQARRFEFGLVQRARLLIDGANAHRVETWISSYETSEPGSTRHSLYE